jgi:hypothetical protein
MEMEKMMAYLLAEMKINQAKTVTNLKEMKYEMRASHEELMAVMKTGHKELMAITEINQEKMMAKSDVHHERMKARIDSQLQKMYTTDLEANSEKSEAGRAAGSPLRKGPQ